MQELHADASPLRGTQCLRPINTVFRAFHQKNLLVLNYHGVVPDELAQNPLLHPNVVGVNEFWRQMETVKQLFYPIAPSELRDWRAGNGRVSRRAALITFDDGYSNNLTYAVPVLEHFSIPALFTICPGYVGSDRILWPDEIHWSVLCWPEKTIPMPSLQHERVVPHDFDRRVALANRLRELCKQFPAEQILRYLAKLRKHEFPKPDRDIYAFLSWDDVASLKRRGFEIGSHTVEHPILTQVTRDRLVRELKDSKEIIEQRIDRECTFFAYPNGGASDISFSVVQEVRNAGYQFAFTVMGRLASQYDDPLLIDRVYIPAASSATAFETRISGFRSTLKQWLNG